MDEDQVRRREHRLHRHRDRSVQPEHALRGELPAPPHGLLLQRRRSGQRALEDRRRRAHVDEAHRRRSAAGHYGRIALDVARSNPNVVYAQIENEGPRRRDCRAGGGRGRVVARARRGWRRSRRLRLVQQWRTWSRLRRRERRTPTRAGTDAEPARGPGIYRSENKGRTWTLVSNCNGRPMYFSNIRVDPTNDKVLFVANTRAAKSLDGGKTFIGIDEGLGFGNQTVDQHAYWIDPSNPQHILRGSDSGFARQLGPGSHVGVRAHDGDGARVSRDRGHAPAVQRLLRPAGQRRLGRPERDAEPRRDSQQQLVPRELREQRRRISDRGRSDAIATPSIPRRRTVARCAPTCAPGITKSIRPVAPPAAERALRQQPAHAWTAGSSRRPAAARWRRRWWWRRRGGAAAHAERRERAAGRHVSLQLEHADPAVAAQSEHDLDGRQPALPVRQPGRPLDRERRSHEAGRPLQGRP